MTIIFTIIINLWLINKIIKENNGQYRNIILVNYLVRAIALIGTCTDVIPLMSAHSDSDYFDDLATSNQSRSFSSWDIATNYTIFLSVLYSFTDSSRWFAQFLNMAMSVYTLVVLRQILFLFQIPSKTRKFVLLVMAFLPFYINYSVILVRESWIIMFVTLSLYRFICWYIGKGNRNRNMILSVIFLILGLWMHAGVICVLVGYFLAFITYDYKTNSIKLSRRSYVGFCFIALMAVVIFVWRDVFLAKLMSEDTMDYIETKNTSEKANSAYLTWLEYSSPEKVLLFSPLKMFYFFYSPIPLNWRGLNDILAFFFDSSVFIISSWYALTRSVYDERYKLLKRFLVISLLATTFVFAFGTVSSGDAIRHREKTMCILLIISAISTVKNKKRNKKTHRKFNEITISNTTR